MSKMIDQSFSFRADTTVNAGVIALPFPGRVQLTRLTVVRVGGGAIATDIYNRAFVLPTQTVRVRAVTAAEAAFFTSRNTYKIIANAYSELIIIESTTPIGSPLKNPLLIRAGDDFQITVSAGSAYNGTLRVAWVSDDLRSALLERVYTVNDPGATGLLNIASANQILWQVVPQQTGTGSLTTSFDTYGNVVYHNRDVVDPFNHRGVIRRIYLKFGATAAYEVSIAAIDDTGN